MGNFYVNYTIRGATQQAVADVLTSLPEQIPVEFCYMGWQESLMQLAKLVEPEIPG